MGSFVLGGRVRGVGANVITGEVFTEVTNQATYNVGESDNMLLIKATTTNVVVNLPSANLYGGRGINFIIEDIGASFHVSFVPNGADTIDGINAAYILSHKNEGAFSLAHSGHWHISQKKGRHEDEARLSANASGDFAATTTPTKVTASLDAVYTSNGKTEANAASSQFDLKDLQTSSKYALVGDIKFSVNANDTVKFQAYIDDNGVFKAIDEVYSELEVKSGFLYQFLFNNQFSISKYILGGAMSATSIHFKVSTSAGSATINFKIGSSVKIERVER